MQQKHKQDAGAEKIEENSKSGHFFPLLNSASHVFFDISRSTLFFSFLFAVTQPAHNKPRAP
jgi:hypothetical protein